MINEEDYFDDEPLDKKDIVPFLIHMTLIIANVLLFIFNFYKRQH